MKDADLLLKSYFDKSPTPKNKARLSLIALMLTLGGYNLIGNLGLAGVLVYRSPKGKFVCVKTAVITTITVNGL